MNVELVVRTCERFHLWAGLPFLLSELWHVGRHYVWRYAWKYGRLYGPKLAHKLVLASRSLARSFARRML